MTRLARLLLPPTLATSIMFGLLGFGEVFTSVEASTQPVQNCVGNACGTDASTADCLNTSCSQDECFECVAFYPEDEPQYCGCSKG